MNLPDLIETYGYAAVFLGAVLEGETVLLLAGFAAHRGYLSLPAVMMAAFLGGVAGDQLFFHLGRHFGPRLPERFPRLRSRLERVNALLRRHAIPLVLGMRFLYGLRTAGPTAVGMSGFSPWRFLMLNLVGALVWATVISGAGYLFGQALEWLSADLRRYEIDAAAGLALVGLIALWLQKRREIARNKTLR